MWTTDYRPLKELSARKLFDGRLGKFNVREHVKRGETTESYRCLTDGEVYVWVSINASGVVYNIRATGSRTIARYGDPEKLLHAIGKTFNTYIASEHEPQYWGFDTQEEWHKWHKRNARTRR